MDAELVAERDTTQHCSKEEVGEEAVDCLKEEGEINDLAFEGHHHFSCREGVEEEVHYDCLLKEGLAADALAGWKMAGCHYLQ